MRHLDRLAALGLALTIAAPSALADDKRPEPQAPAMAPAPGPDSVQDLIFLGDNRPIFMRLRMTLGSQPFRLAWMNSVKAMHAYLDRNNDGKVTKEEADRGALSTLVRVANGGATAMPRGDLDNHPKDGVISIDELSDALRTALGPFRVQVGKIASGKTDVLFEHLDQNKDGKLSRLELTDAASSLHKLDLDDDELIDGVELEPFTNPTAMQMDNIPGQRGRTPDGPPVVELFPDDSSLRPVRQLLKKYDKGTSKSASGGDNKLTNAEFAIEASAFVRADADADGALDTEELRRFLAKPSPDIELTVNLSADTTGSATVSVTGSGSKALPPWAKVKQLGPADVEIAADEVRLEVHVDDGAAALADSKRSYMAQFEAADADNNGYVEKSEVTKDKDHPSPLAGLFDILDRDGDGKLYPKELDEFVDSQARAARDRMVLTASDQGRAIFSILDLNRDRRLGNREIRGTLDRVVTWDRDGDAQITAEEIPHQPSAGASSVELATLWSSSRG
jgi:Ca2+-binding EF-hand superfamily protein